MRCLALAALTLLLAPITAAAAPGDLDPTYGTRGATALATGAGTRSSPVLGLDVGVSNIVTVRVVAEGGRYRPRLERLGLDGAADPAFTPVTLAAGDGDFVPTGLDRDASGRIYVAGFARVGRVPAFAVVRTSATGALDATFGTGGRALVPYAGLAPDLEQAVEFSNPAGAPPTLLSDGGVALVLRAGAGAGELAAAVLRLDAAGVPVAAFAGDGIADPQPATTGIAPTAAVEDAAGRILLTGEPVGLPAQPLVVVALTATGAADTTYGGGDGVATTALGGTIDGGALVRVGAGVVAAAVNGSRAFVLARFTAAGQLDATFDGDGVDTSADTNVGSLAGAVLGLAGGLNVRIDVAGTSLAGIVFRRANLSTGFEAVGGTVTIPAGDFVSARALALGTGGPYAGGLLREESARRPYLASWDFAGDVARAAFGTGGQVIGAVPEPGRETFVAQAGVLLPGGALRLVGAGGVDDAVGARVVALGAAGAPATGFGSGGVSTVGPGGSFDSWGDAAVLPGGRLALAGTTRSGAAFRPAGLVQTPSGTIDGAFAPFTLALPSAIASASVVVPDAVGLVYGISGFSPARTGIVRYRLNGGRDLTFGGDGFAEASTGSSDVVADVLRQPSGRLVVAVRPSAPSGASVLRAFTRTGATDRSFGTSGAVGLPSDFAPVTLVALPGGDIAVGGVLVSTARPTSAIVRLSRDGRLRTTFAGDGLLELGDPRDGVRIAGLAASPDGRIYGAFTVLSSSFVDGTPLFNAGVRVVRLRASGQPDRTFGGDGVVDPPLGPTVSPAGIAIEPGGRLLLSAADEGLAVAARLLGDRPLAVTRRADRLGRTTARVAGRITPRGGRTRWWIEYGRSAGYGRRTRARVVGPATATTVRATLRGLRPGTRYHARVVAVNGSGRTLGPDRTFRTRG